MNRVKPILILLLPFLCSTIVAGQSTELAPSFQEAHQAYGEANYPLAIESFQKILETAGNDATSSMYYNLGCALYKDGQLAPAILQFSRAYRLAPSDADVRFNLQLASSQIEDKMEPLPTFFLTNWLNRASHWFSLRAWIWIALVAFLLFVLCVVFYFVTRSSAGKKAGFYSAVALLLIAVFSNLMLYRSHQFVFNRTEAIVMAEVITIKSSPDQSAQDIVVIHSGLKVNIEQYLAGYAEVKLPDGTIGWVPSTAIEPIYNFAN